MVPLASLALVLAVVGCGHPENAAPAGTLEPVQPQPAPPAAPKPSEGRCEVKITVAVGSYRYSGGGVQGTAKTAAALRTALSPLAAKCDAVVATPKSIPYQEVITVMDAAMAAGITNVRLDVEGAPKPPVTGEKPDPERLPFVIVTKTEVTVDDKLVGKPTDPTLDAKIENALVAVKPKHVGPWVVLQAEKDLPSDAIRLIVRGASQAGYTNVLFDVKR
jgi:biopolymer transport protein ExbD